jgi:hypothetical protein
MADRLVLPEFKRSYRSIQRGFPKPLAHLLYGFMVWLQEIYINLKVTAAVDTAIRDYEQEEETPPSLTEGVLSSTGDDFFDEIRIQARYTLTPNNINDDGTNL